MRTFLSICLLLFSVAVFPAPSWSAGVEGIVERLQKKYESISTIEASFTQDVYTASLKRSEVNEGRVFFKKPGKWKWLYNDPAKGYFSSDGKKVWIYEPDFNQVVEKDVDAGSRGITTDFLTGVGNLKRDFTVKLAEERESSWVLELTPLTPLPNVKKLLLEVDKSSLLVIKTVVADPFGNKIEVSFRDLKINPGIDDSVFALKPPKGSIVVRP